MMPQLLAHLWGDYLLQSQWMAVNKTRKLWIAFVHAICYGLAFIPVLYFTPVHHPVLVLLVIVGTHAPIDRYRLIRYVIWAKNWISPEGFLPWSNCTVTGYNDNAPEWLTKWLLFISDNTLHLTINYLALRFL